jgi:hypothetical protein
VGDLFKMNTAVSTASPQNQLGMDMAFIMLRAIPMTNWFLLSTTPFCSGV